MDYASSLLNLLPANRRKPGLRDLLNSADSYLPAEQVERIRAAAEFGATAHEGQKRQSGEPYIAHPVAAAQILADLHLDPDTIIAAILHDVIEDTPISKQELAEKFGAPVAEIVDGVTKLDQIQFQEPRGSAGRELPQDGAGDGARSARHPGQAGRPHAQHAHARGDDARASAARSRARRSTSTRRSPTGSASTASSSNSRISVSARSTRSATGCSSAR